ncbi:hypothetical protein BS47DRAFT_1366047 [Hydnum rufescens UP504]|uniref:Uncharacterized protein n=1 Tax=Hydnum rufescens UP504 TaxID=1448309 RepID=A0A9P6DRA8_9AGAM|nr:hypothetical protein BS47DRAFT_1366047 [Hydnum rufescens UP504]
MTTRQTNPTNSNESKPNASPRRTPHLLRRVCGNLSNKSKPRCKPQTNPTPTLAGILLNPHPPTEATTLPSENMRPWVRGNPTVKHEIMSPVPHTRPSGTTHLLEWSTTHQSGIKHGTPE